MLPFQYKTLQKFKRAQPDSVYAGILEESKGNSHTSNPSSSLAPGAKESGYCADYRQMLKTSRIFVAVRRAEF